MEMMRALQKEMAASRANQERIQADLVASQATSEELRRSNEELRRDLQTHATEREGANKEPVTPPREFPTSFSPEIVDAVIPATLVGPKVTFTGMEDPEAHLTTFHTQMMLVGGSDAGRCKLFMSTLVGTTMDWFINLPDGHVTSFPQLTKLFRAQYLANRAPPSVSYDLFDVRQYQRESLKEFLHHFGAQMVRLNLTEEKMMVHAFRKVIVSGPFNESLIRNHPKTFTEIRRCAVAHIAAEEEVSEKRTCVVPTRPHATGRPQTLRVHEATIEMKAPVKQQPYQKPNARGHERDNVPPRHDFIVELKDLIAIPNIAERLKVPPKTDKRLGPDNNAWCEFHQAFGHPIHNCLALGHQLDELVKNGLLRDYLQEKQGIEDVTGLSRVGNPPRRTKNLKTKHTGLRR
ncbi:uncharacterized protein [Phaseolus vulgaris]|uniref:uncharacterized protein n=1 Tax=Phaseolus vulgaris TaxID=3885 RepID=UPI0035CA4F2A